MDTAFFEEGNETKEVRFTKDLNRQFTYVNDYFINIVKYYAGIDIKKEFILGKSGDGFLPKKSIDFFQQLENDVLEKKCLITRFTVFKFKLHTVNAVVLEKPYYKEDTMVGYIALVRYLNLFHIDGQHVMLSSRELHILVHLAFGFKLKTIADNLDISLGTVVSYVASVKNKLGFHHQQKLLLILKEHAIAQHLFDFYFNVILKNKTVT